MYHQLCTNCACCLVSYGKMQVHCISRNKPLNALRPLNHNEILRVANELLKTGDYSPDASVQLECEAWYTRSLLGVRKLREIAVKKTTTMGPFKLRDLVPATSEAPRL